MPTRSRCHRGPGQTLAEALAEADAGGYNAVEFDELAFVATREAPDHDHPGLPPHHALVLPVRAAALASRDCLEAPAEGGSGRPPEGIRRNSAAGGSRRSASFSVTTSILSHEHMLRKYVHRRYDSAEVRHGWHGWRARLTAGAIRLPSQAELRFTATTPISTHRRRDASTGSNGRCMPDAASRPTRARWSSASSIAPIGRTTARPRHSPPRSPGNTGW